MNRGILDLQRIMDRNDSMYNEVILAGWGIRRAIELNAQEDSRWDIDDQEPAGDWQ